MVLTTSLRIKLLELWLDFLLNLMSELKNILVDIVEMTKNINGHIIDSSI